MQLGLNSLIAQSKFFGTGSCFVQGAGGNLSFKNDSSLLIKASGTRLIDADSSSIYIELDLYASRQEVLINENLSHLVIGPNPLNQRPSIETAIHSLLPHNFVTHLHAIGAISRAIDVNISAHLDQLNTIAPTIYVPYAKPGIPLANSILKELSTSSTNKEDNLLVLLGNHGIIGASKSASSVEEILKEVENLWAPELIEIKSKTNSEEEWQLLAEAGSLDFRTSEILLGGLLTPDQSVFLGKIPFTRWDIAQKHSQLMIKDDGSVWGNSELSNDAWEIAGSFVRVAAATSEDCVPNYLSEQDYEELINWDAEKWRKAQER